MGAQPSKSTPSTTQGELPAVMPAAADLPRPPAPVPATESDSDAGILIDEPGSDYDEFPYPRNWKCCLCNFIIPRSIGDAGPLLMPGYGDDSDVETEQKANKTCPKCRNLRCPLCTGTCSLKGPQRTRQKKKSLP